MSRKWLSHPRWTIARRDLSALRSEKTIVLALLIQLFIAAFSSFLVVGLTSLYDPDATEGQDIVVGVSGETQDRLIALAEQTDDITIEEYATESGAFEAFENGRIDAILLAETRPAESGSVLEVNAIVPAEDLRTTVIVVTLREFLSDLETTERSQRVHFLEYEPLEVPEERGASPYFAFTYTILLPLLLFLPPFISGSIAVDSITEEIERGTLELLRVSPASLVDIVDGKAMGMVAIAPAQAALWMLLLRFNGIAIAHVGWLLAFVTAMAVITVIIGVVLALLIRQRKQAQLLYSMLVLGFFGLLVALPEHPAGTVAKLAVDSATATTYTSVFLFVALAVGLYAGTRLFIDRVDPESL